MSKPRIFLSSTYYDLKHIRTSLESFIRDTLHYEPVLHNYGGVTWQKTDSLENDCYKEIEACDMLVNIVGSRFGSQSEENSFSISNNELFKAINNKKYVYVFVEKKVYYEIESFEKNRAVENYLPVVDKRILEFLIELKNKHGSHVPIFHFEEVKDITSTLSNQFAGLFASFLKTQEVKITERSLSPIRKSKIEYKPFWKNATAIKDNLKYNDIKTEGIWRTEFKKEKGVGFSCGLSIEIPHNTIVKEFDLSASKFESYGVVTLEFFLDKERNRSNYLMEKMKQIL